MSRGLSPQEKAELWRRWKAGETVAQIARTMGKSNLSLFGVVWPYGGIAPRERCHLDRIALRLNQRPRKTLGFSTPAATLSAYVASTG